MTPEEALKSRIRELAREDDPKRFRELVLQAVSGPFRVALTTGGVFAGGVPVQVPEQCPHCESWLDPDAVFLFGSSPSYRGVRVDGRQLKVSSEESDVFFEDDFKVVAVHCGHCTQVVVGPQALEAPPEAPEVKASIVSQVPEVSSLDLPELLLTLCDSLDDPEPGAVGRPPLPARHVAFAAVLMSAYQMSTRRVGALVQPLLGCSLHYNSISDYLRRPDFSVVLETLLHRSASLLSGLDQQQRLEMTSFGAPLFRSCGVGQKRQRVRVVSHLTTGVTTRSVVALTAGLEDEDPILTVEPQRVATPPLLSPPAVFGGFPSDVSAGRLIKEETGDRLSSKTLRAQVNEVLCKVIAHNLRLIERFRELAPPPESSAEALSVPVSSASKSTDEELAALGLEEGRVGPNPFASGVGDEDG